MEPKFQSSFIPKNPVTSTATTDASARYRSNDRNLFGFIAVVIFVISVALAIAVFGYRFYLNYSIDKMSKDLDNQWTTLEPTKIQGLTDLDNRIIATQTLISNHQVTVPLFEFLEKTTPVTVRFTNFHYSVGREGVVLKMVGEARGYTALAAQADIFNNSGYFEDAIFSDFKLNDNGNVTFSFSAQIDPNLVSYTKDVEMLTTPPPAQVVAPTTATTSINQTSN